MIEGYLCTRGEGDNEVKVIVLTTGPAKALSTVMLSQLDDEDDDPDRLLAATVVRAEQFDRFTKPLPCGNPSPWPHHTVIPYAKPSTLRTASCKCRICIDARNNNHRTFAGHICDHCGYHDYKWANMVHHFRKAHIGRV